MQNPVTPLMDDSSPDLATFERLFEFHVHTGTTSFFTALAAIASLLVQRLYW